MAKIQILDLPQISKNQELKDLTKVEQSSVLGGISQAQWNEALALIDALPYLDTAFGHWDSHISIIYATW